MDALTQARKQLADRLKDPKVKMLPGLADDLRAIDAAFAHVQLALSNLAAFSLRKHFWPMSQVHPGQLKALTELGTDPATVARIAQHGERCTCEQCMGVG